MNDEGKGKEDCKSYNDDILDLTMAELYIMQYLLRYNEPTVRSVLYQEINAHLLSPKKIVQSSFYNKIDKLEARGYLSFNRTDLGKVESVEITEGARRFMSDISKLTLFASLDLSDLTESILELVMGQLNVSEYNSALWISLEDHLALKTYPFHLVIDKFEDLYYLTETPDDVRIRGELREQIKYSRISQGIIREPDNFFDISALIGCLGDETIYGASGMEITREALRVTKPGGLLFFTVDIDFPKTDHYLLDMIARDITNSSYYHSMSEESLREIMNQLGLEEIVIHKHRGFHVAWGTVTK